MKQDGLEISWDAMGIEGILFFIEATLAQEFFLGLAQFPEFFCTIFFSIKKKLPNLLQL